MSGNSHGHTHAHDHGHHHHGHPVGILDGPVLLDIGDGYGALIVTMPDEALGTELHVRRPGEEATTHTGVWRRTVGDHSSVIAVFPELTVGNWSLLDQHGAAVAEVVIEDASVTTTDLR